MDNTNDSKLTQIISIVQENQKIQQEYYKAQQKQQKILEAVVRETKEFREEQQTRYILQRKEDDKRFETTQHQIAALSAKLDRIEANTIIIKDVLISDFAGISPAMKKAIETSGQAAMEDPTDRRAIGIWVSRVMSKLFCANFHGKYPPKTVDLVGNLVLFHQTERSENGRKY